MDFERFTRKAQEAVQNAASFATQRGNPEIAPLHLLLALLGQSEGLVFPVLERLGTTPTALRTAVTTALDALPSARGAKQQPGLSRGAVTVLEEALSTAKALGDDYTSTEHLLLALAGEKGPAGQALRSAGVEGDAL